MKKFLTTMFALLITAGAYAFEFDGINLNGKVLEISREISKRGYSQDYETNTLKGNCRGTDIYLSYNYVDVSQPGRIGEFYVDIDTKEPNALEVMRTTFNIIYHVGATKNGVNIYDVSDDGTKLTVTEGPRGVRLTYITPFYKAPKK